MRLSTMVNAVLAVAVLISALGVVHSVWRNRTLYSQMRDLRHQRNQLEVEWGRLLLEQSTWSTRARIQQIAREKLNMHEPDTIQRVVVRP